jgi:hypothetical protein
VKQWTGREVNVMIRGHGWCMGEVEKKTESEMESPLIIFQSIGDKKIP